MKKIIKNACIYSLDEKLNPQKKFSSMLINGSKIQALDTTENIQNADIIDLAGKTVIPSFTDSHVHFFQSGFFLSDGDLSHVQNNEQLLEEIKLRIKGRSFFQSWGYDPKEDLPSKDMIDAISSEIPIFIRRRDGHSSVLNSNALGRIEKLLEKFPESSVNWDKGQLFDAAHMEVDRYFLNLTDKDDLKKAMLAVEDRALSVGVTSIHSLVHRLDWAEEFLKLKEESRLVLEMFLENWIPQNAHELNLRRIGGCLLLDGSFGSRTAAISCNYKDKSSSCGNLYKTQEDLNEFIIEARKYDLQTAFHAIGDRAVEQVIKMHEYDKGMHNPLLRHRIEHAEIINDEQIDRICELGLVLSMQPVFEYFWGGMDNLYGKRLGELSLRTNRYRTLLEHDIVIAGGSDSYVTPIHPMLGVHGAVNHPNSNETVGVFDALRMFTYAGAYAIGNEKFYGMLKEEFDASFIVLEDDPFKIEKSRLKDIEVLQTWNKGKKLFERSDNDR